MAYEMVGFQQAAICENGHVYSSALDPATRDAPSFCGRCGAPVISECLGCQAALRGRYVVPNVVRLAKYRAPAYCFNCGQPLPWTLSRLEAARELAADAEELSEEDRTALAGTLEDLVRDTPRSPVAMKRYQRLVAKLSRSGADAFREVLVDIVSETARKAIWG